MMNTKGLSMTKLIIGFLIGILTLIIAISLWNNLAFREAISIIIPNPVPPENGNVDDYGFNCTYYVGYVRNDLVQFCTDQSCTNTYPSKIQIEDDRIEVDQYYDEVIGSIQNDRFLFIFDSVRNWQETEDGLIAEIEGDVTLEDVLKLDGAFFTNSRRDTICRAEAHAIDTFRLENEAVGRSVNVDGYVYYFSMDAFLQNMLQNQNTPMYLDEALQQRANTYIQPDKKIMRVRETLFADTKDVGERDISQFKWQFLSDQSVSSVERDLGVRVVLRNDPQTGNAIASDIYIMKEPINQNTPNIDLGSYASFTTFRSVQYIKWNDHVYLRFIGSAGGQGVIETPYILQDYWSAYTSFQTIPRWAKPGFEQQ